MTTLCISLPAQELDRGGSAEAAAGPGPHDGAGDRRDPTEVPI